MSSGRCFDFKNLTRKRLDSKALGGRKIINFFNKLRVKPAYNFFSTGKSITKNFDFRFKGKDSVRYICRQPKVLTLVPTKSGKWDISRDAVRANVTKGKKQGIYKGRVAIRKCESFNLQTVNGLIQRISWNCLLVHRSDGYSYQYREKMEAAFPHRPNGGISTLKI